jgi:DNA-binding transcriptional ArsR family regulator
MDNITAEIASEKINNQPAGAGITHLPSLAWELGTAYEFFVSLYVLHHPDEFGLRASWAAGVRSRLDADARKTLEQAQEVMGVPLGWIHSLPGTKDAAGALWALRQIPAATRLYNLVFCCEEMRSSKLAEIFRGVTERQSWNSGDVGEVDEILRTWHHKSKIDKIPAMLDIWANASDFGERFLTALQAFYQVFFAEEEKQLLPKLDAGLARAQKLSENFSLLELLESLSQGIVMADVQKHDGLVLVPSIWSTPIIFYDELENNQMIIAFGARPADASLVPGEVVPDALLQILKAMADPTRLRILRYLAHASLTPAEIARRLRLRPPTVTHHLSALRLAGLVHMHLEKDERRYTARLEALEGLHQQILDFVGNHTDIVD